MSLHALTRSPCTSLAQCELTFVERSPIDVPRALQQHEAYCQVLRRAGVEVQTLPPDEGLPDSVFVEDAAVVLDEIAIITRPGAVSRRDELPSIIAELEPYRQLVRICPPATLEGGDVLRIKRDLYVGLSSRTNGEGVVQLAAIVDPLGYRVVPVALRNCLHLKTAVTALDEQTLILNPEWLDTAPLQHFRQLRTPLDEPFGSNTLRLSEVIFLSARFPQTRDLLERHRYRTQVVGISELEKAEAGLTCLSILFHGGVMER